MKRTRCRCCSYPHFPPKVRRTGSSSPARYGEPSNLRATADGGGGVGSEPPVELGQGRGGVAGELEGVGSPNGGSEVGDLAREYREVLECRNGGDGGGSSQVGDEAGVKEPVEGSGIDAVGNGARVAGNGTSDGIGEGIGAREGVGVAQECGRCSVVSG